MASPTASEASDDGDPPLLRLLNHQDLSLFLPFMLGLSDHHPPPPAQPDRIVLINPITQSTVVLDGPTTGTLDPLIRRPSPYPPASLSSIEALPRVEIAVESSGCPSLPSCCVICLEELEEWAREMPCRHRFHGHCIERWLRINGSCPVCRYRMPVDEAELRKLATETDDQTSDPYRRHHHHHYNNHGRRDAEIWVSFSFSRNNNARSSGDDPTSSGDVHQLLE